MLSKRAIKLIFHLTGPLIFLYIIFQIDYSSLFGILKTIEIYLLVSAVIVMALEIIIKSFRWQIILRMLNIYINKLKAVELFWLGALVGVITPGRLGELIKVYFLKNKGFDTFRSFLSIVFDRITDVLFLLFLGVLIFLFYLNVIGIYLALLGVIFLVLILLIYFVINRESYLNKLLSRFVSVILPVDFDSYNRFTFEKVWKGIRNLKIKDISAFALYLFIGWLFYFLSRYIIAVSMGLDLSFINIAVISTSIAIVSALPISVAGLGTREAVVIYFFNLFGLSMENAILFSLLIFAIDLAVVSFGLIPYYKESSLINRAKSLESRAYNE